MNVFFIHAHPVVAAQWQFDQHNQKMLLEGAQLLSCSAIYHGAPVPDREIPASERDYYLPGHAMNHPCAVWARKTRANWLWLMAHSMAIAEEFAHRRGKRHASERVVLFLYQNQQWAPPPGPFTPPPQAIAPSCYHWDTVLAYRRYYVAVKAHSLKNGPPTWSDRTRIPPWWKRVKRFLRYARQHFGHTLEDQRTQAYLEQWITPLLVENEINQRGDWWLQNTRRSQAIRTTTHSTTWKLHSDGLWSCPT